jgi:hypothetical protein
MTLRLAIVLTVAACGADAASTPPPASPKPAPAPVAAADDCRRACEYQASCLPAGYRDHDPTACIAECRASLVSPDPKEPGRLATIWADCLTQVPCAEIEKSMAMDMGPAGWCFAKAIDID